MTSRTARCSCGRLEARTLDEPIRVSVCHCLACQRRTGGPFAMQARFAASAVSISGVSSRFIWTGDAGGRSVFHFCPTCAATVYYISEGREDSVAIPVGAFADPGFPPPTISVYEERMHGWVRMPEDIERMD